MLHKIGGGCHDTIFMNKHFSPRQHPTNHHDASETVGVDGVVSEAYLVSLASSIYHVVLGQVEQETTLVLVVYLGYGPTC